MAEVIQEHDNDIYIKERNRIEAYLIRIIQRYFDIYYNQTEESMESIINEALTRFKQIALTETEHGFLFGLNNMTGHITMSIQSLKGEFAFDKNTAFNKDFGNAANTILMGNDPRLSDDRTPKQHEHEIFSIDTLQDKFEQLMPVITNTHGHNNLGLLSKLRYTGAMTSFDLVLLEELKNSISYYVETVEQDGRKETSDSNAILEALQTALDKINGYITLLNEIGNINNYVLNIAKQYIDEQNEAFVKRIKNKLTDCITQEQGTELVNKYKGISILKASNTVALTNGTLSAIPVNKDGKWYTNVKSASVQTFSVPNGNVKLFMQFKNGTDVISIPLPFMYQVDDYTIVIQGRCEASQVSIETTILNTIEGYNAGHIYDANHILICDKTKEIKLWLNDDKLFTINDVNDFNNLISIMDTDNYYIAGYNYEDWDVGQPITSDWDTMPYISSNKKLALKVWNNDTGNEKGAILKYPIKLLNDLFDTPQIYYQVFAPEVT